MEQSVGGSCVDVRELHDEVDVQRAAAGDDYMKTAYASRAILE